MVSWKILRQVGSGNSMEGHQALTGLYFCSLGPRNAQDQRRAEAEVINRAF